MTTQLQVAVCIGCGCDDNHACAGSLGDPCHWLTLDRRGRVGVCSECPDEMRRWNTGDRTPAPGQEGDR
jgi:hypothetical protein